MVVRGRFPGGDDPALAQRLEPFLPAEQSRCLPDLTSPVAATAIATLAAVISSGASYTTITSYSPNGKPATKTLAPSSSSVGAIASMGSCGSVS